jgi:hypothetical protein
MRDIPADDLNALADRLRGWQPSTGGLDRDRLIFEAGRAAGLAEARASFHRRFWPLAMAASLLLATGLFMTRHPEPVEVAEVSPQPPRPIVVSPPIPPIDPNSYLALTRQIAAGGLDPIRRDSPRPESDPSISVDRPPPLRARDIDRLLNL